jgi:transposase
MLLKTACGKNKAEQKSFLNDVENRLKMVDYLRQFADKHHAKRIVFVYEASGLGFGLYDLLLDHEIECYVLSPTHLPKTPKSKRNKTDAKDAQMLFEQARGFVLAGNELPVVWTPPQRLRNDRELVRARLEAGEASTQVKLKILSMLKRFNQPVPGFFVKSRNWSKKFTAWLGRLAETMDATVAPVLLALVTRFETLRSEITDLERHIRQLARADRYKTTYEKLTQLRGVGMLTAMTFLTEIGDALRFSNRRQIAAYLGVVPSANESGEADDRKGRITRQGPGRVRKVLCQASWTAVRLDADVRQQWQRIKGNGKKGGKKAIVAIMRKLAIRMWHLMFECGTPQELVGSGRAGCVTSAQTPQKGPPLSSSPSLQPQTAAQAEATAMRKGLGESF